MLNPDRSCRKAVEVILVTTPRCHFCDDASKILESLSDLYPLMVREVKLESDEGTAIAARFRVPFPPVLLIEGAYFGHGRISRRKLTKALDAMSRTQVSR